MSRLTRVALLLTSLATCCGVALAASAVPDAKTRTFAVRAAGPVSDDYMRAFMDLVESKQLPRENYPDLNQLSANQIISVLCGSFNQAYWDKLQELNQPVGLSPDPNAIIGELAYKVNWPACLIVDTKPAQSYTVKPGDTAFNVYRNLTGTPGGSQVVDEYFQSSGIRDLNKLKPGQTLVPNHTTTATVVHASFSPNNLKSKLSAYKTSNVVKISFDESLPDTSLPESGIPEFQIAAGKTQSYKNPAECEDPSAPAESFNSLWLSNAYKDSLQALRLLNLDQSFTRVAIADNGFFGANVVAGKLVFGSHFPSRFFMNKMTGGTGIIGPMTMSGKQIYPINYLNGKTNASIVSGHGTHITGLVLGGSSFQPYLSVFDRPGGGSWLRLWIVNVGNGEETLIPNSTSELSQQLNLLNNSVINLSLEYDAGAGSNSNQIFLRLVESNNLFVVSAGNDGKADVSDAPYYPAAFGGSSQRNVISVAAHKPDGELAAFSNRSATKVDLAAPGCDLSSWLNDSEKVTKVSGTSQAAALVTFTAALLKSFDNMASVEIKNRLMVSGDLLKKSPHQSSKNTPDPGEVLSRSKLNAARALYVFDDYVKYTSHADGTVHEVLGEFLGLPNLNCVQPVSLENLWAVKASEEGFWFYKGKKTPLEVVLAPCLAKASTDAVLKIKIRAELNAEGVPVPVADSPVLDVQATELNLLVTASRPYRQSL